MKLIRKLALGLWWAGLLTVSSTNAQSIDATTGNIISPTGWTGVTYMTSNQVSAVESGNYWGGPAFNTGTNTIRFSFGTTDIVQQTVNLESVLSGLGTGLKVSGFSYRFKLMSASGDTLIGTFTTKDNAGNEINNTSVNFSGINTGGAFTSGLSDPQGTVVYDKLYAPTSLSSFTASFQGHDAKWWAGLYGPRVRDFSVGFNYTGGGSEGGGSGGSPSVPPAATAMPKSAATTAPIDTTKTDATVVTSGGVEIANGTVAVVDNIPQAVKDTFVRDANELGKKEKEKAVIRVARPVEVVLPKRSVQSSTATAANVQTDFEGNDFSVIQFGTAGQKTGGLGLSPTNPVNMTLQSRMPDNNDNVNTAGAVKRNVPNNELAGGVDIAKMALQPVGFADYMNLTITDAAFYTPREVYPNQRVVDNARAQRLLQGASDRRHQEMVNSQYNKEPK